MDRGRNNDVPASLRDPAVLRFRGCRITWIEYASSAAPGSRNSDFLTGSHIDNSGDCDSGGVFAGDPFSAVSYGTVDRQTAADYDNAAPDQNGIGYR
jgi:hypothetical protein